MLKETIDRMRFDMDELRNSAFSLEKGGGSGTASAHGSVSKSLGAELLSKMKDGNWEMEEEVESEPNSLEIEVTPEGDETESEDYVQTIITRTMTHLSPGFLVLYHTHRVLSVSRRSRVVGAA